MCELMALLLMFNMSYMYIYEITSIDFFRSYVMHLMMWYLVFNISSTILEIPKYLLQINTIRYK